MSNNKQRIKEELEYLMAQQRKVLTSWYVYYRSKCCGKDHPVLVDRYPFSEKIITQCKKCKKYTKTCLLEPLEFQAPWLNKDVTIEEMKEMYIDPNHYQTRIIQEIIENEGG